MFNTSYWHALWVTLTLDTHSGDQRDRDRQTGRETYKHVCLSVCLKQADSAYCDNRQFGWFPKERYFIKRFEVSSSHYCKCSSLICLILFTIFNVLTAACLIMFRDRAVRTRNFAKLWMKNLTVINKSLDLWVLRTFGGSYENTV